MIGGIVMLLLPGAPGSAQPTGSAKTLDLKIDLTQASGLDAAKVLRPGLTAYGADTITASVWDKTLSEVRVGYVVVDPRSQIILPSTSLEDMKSRMKAQDKLIMDIVRNGGRVLYVFQCVPRWISSQPRNESKVGVSDKTWYSVAPSDYGKWQEVVRAFVQHFNKQLNTGGAVTYMIGSEPDNYWKGEEYDFYKYYEFAVKGALQADPEARVGGITPANHLSSVFNTTGKATRGNRPMLQNWIGYCAQAHLPIHFVTWHIYPGGSPVPRGTTAWNAAAKDIKGWLGESGYKDAELIVTDWPEWRPHPESDTEVKAAWVASGMMSLVDSGISMTHLLQDTQINEQLMKTNGSFGNGNGLFTRAGIAKPAYNAVVAVSRMQGQVLSVNTGDPFVTSIATVGNGKVYVLLSYFVPPDWLLPINLFDPATDLSVIVKAGSGPTKGVFENVVKRLAEGQSVTIPGQFSNETKAYLQNVAGFGRAAKARGGVPVDVRLAFEGIADGSWASEEFVVDSRRSNSFAQRKDIQAKLTPYLRPDADVRSAQSVIGQIDAAANLQSARTKQVLAQSSRLAMSTTLDPYAVHLLVLSKGGQPAPAASVK
ncbi:MAG: hypothetical protein AUG09_03435 [Acidobacteria bacterium 13_1_20CM_2_68_7]|nr:MAG: hypothetical protein AUG09_03435 [Acidobacteria bacterium 13_1_20CM_2_68_7]